MFNALKYTKSLEAVGFRRDQAEAQVQLILDAIEDNVATKNDIAEIRSDIAMLQAQFNIFETKIIFKLGALLVVCMTLATTMIGLLIRFGR